MLKNIISRKRYTLPLVLLIILLLFGLYIFNRYKTSHEMTVNVTEFSTSEYPDNPATLSKAYGDYSHKKLKLTQNDDTHFTFTFLSANEKSATIVLKNIDVGFMTPGFPVWIKNDPDLIRIALTDRQWNRQQVSFDPKTIEVTGGDGFEKNHTYSVELAKNCLNAGLWEILLYSLEDGEKTLYYQGWFTFPLGYYGELVEHNTGLPYWKVWYYLEHWFDPEGTFVDVSKLRKAINEGSVKISFNSNTPVIERGEQINKKKNIISEDISVFQDYLEKPVSFSTFSPPGIYTKDKPWKNEYWRISYVRGALIRDIVSPSNPKRVLQELEIIYEGKEGSESRFFISGFDLAALPVVDMNHYDQGQLYLMGIGTPPLKESYRDLQKNPPDKSPFFSVCLTKDDQWINHHEMAVDGSILFIDSNKQLNVCLVSYERHAIIAHYLIDFKQKSAR